MRDQLACVRDLIALRRHEPALCGEAINVYHVHNDNRVMASFTAGWKARPGCGRGCQSQ